MRQGAPLIRDDTLMALGASMVDPRTASWFPTAAYLYVLHLDALALA